jgi:hypothetical protein
LVRLEAHPGQPIRAHPAQWSGPYSELPPKRSPTDHRLSQQIDR